MIGGARVFEFKFATHLGEGYKKHFVSPSEQMAWAMAVGYLIAHTLNPKVTGIELVRDYQVRACGYQQDGTDISPNKAIELIATL